MRFKVDENLPHETCDLWNRAGHDAINVGEQALSSADDVRIHQLCRDEQRALITLDVDFATRRAYDPTSSSGVILLRLARQDKPRVLAAVARALPVLDVSRWRSVCGSSRRLGSGFAGRWRQPLRSQGSRDGRRSSSAFGLAARSLSSFWPG